MGEVSSFPLKDGRLVVTRALGTTAGARRGIQISQQAIGPRGGRTGPTFYALEEVDEQIALLQAKAEGLIAARELGRKWIEDGLATAELE